ncbi:MAG: hypothetical protein NVS2B17_21550 [Candidatus Velthaea sp.]
MDIDPAKPAGIAPKPDLSATQKEALKRLHAAAQQFESVFVDMLFKQMRESAPPTSITGKVSSSEKMFAEMLDEKRAEKLAENGSFGIGKILEEQLKASVLANPERAAQTRMRHEGDL